MVTQLTNYEIPDTIGILLETKLNHVGLFDFPKINYIYSRGIETGLQNIDSIENSIKRRVTKEEVNKRRDVFNQKKPDLLFNNVQVEGITENEQRLYIIQSIKYKEKTIDIDQLKESYFKLIADDHIKSIQPLAYYNRQTGYFDLHLKVEPRRPLDVEFGGNISTRANTFGYLQANFKMFNKHSYNFSTNIFFGKFYNSLSIGGRINSPTRNPFYVSSYFTLNLWDFFTTSTDLIFTDIRPTYIKQSENNFRIEAGIPYTKTGIIDIGIANSNSLDEYYQTNVFNRGDVLDGTTFNAFSGHVRIDKKNYDYRQFPTEGGRKLFSLKYISGKEEFIPGTTAPIPTSVIEQHSYFQINAMYDQYYKFRKFVTLGLMAEAAINNNKLFSNYTATALNAPNFTPTPNSKSLFNEFYRANQYFAIKGPNNTVEYAAKVFTRAHLMAMGALVMQTQFGPLSVEMNYYEKVGQKWFFSVNMGYMLFNKRGF